MKWYVSQFVQFCVYTTICSVILISFIFFKIGTDIMNGVIAGTVAATITNGVAEFLEKES